MTNQIKVDRLCIGTGMYAARVLPAWSRSPCGGLCLCNHVYRTEPPLDLDDDMDLGVLCLFSLTIMWMVIPVFTALYYVLRAL
jgi:hypothetical protein